MIIYIIYTQIKFAKVKEYARANTLLNIINSYFISAVFSYNKLKVNNNGDVVDEAGNIVSPNELFNNSSTSTSSSYNTPVQALKNHKALTKALNNVISEHSSDSTPIQSNHPKTADSIGQISTALGHALSHYDGSYTFGFGP